MSFVTVKTFDNAIDAHLLRSKLESEGIECFLFDENTVSINPLFNIAVDGIKLKIHEKDVEKTKRILKEISETHFTDDDGNIIKCPNCSSTDLIPNFKSNKSKTGLFSTLVSLLLGILPFYNKSVYKCRECNKEFRSN
jgi:DNA-directed RNA polymerase subunit RPC12/RpoP